MTTREQALEKANEMMIKHNPFAVIYGYHIIRAINGREQHEYMASPVMCKTSEDLRKISDSFLSRKSVTREDQSKITGFDVLYGPLEEKIENKTPLSNIEAVNELKRVEVEAPVLSVRSQIRKVIAKNEIGNYLPEFLYHATFRSTVPLIRKHGLGNFEEGADSPWGGVWNDTYKRENEKSQGVFLDTTVQGVVNWIIESGDERLDVDDRIVVFKIATKDLDKELIQLDPNNRTHNREMLRYPYLDSVEDYFSQVTYFYSGAIPYKNLSHVKLSLDKDK